MTNVCDDDDLSYWLKFVRQPETWQEIPVTRRTIAGEFIKGKKQAIAKIASLILVLLLLRTVLLIGGVEPHVFDLALGIIIGILVMIALLMI